MTLECPQCKSPIAREGQRFCYRCGKDLGSYYDSQGVELKSPQAAANVAPTPSPDKAEQQNAPASVVQENSGSIETMLIDQREITIDPSSAQPASERKATLKILLPTGDVFDRDITEGETRMGKGPRNDIVIADPAVSASHSAIRAEAGAYIVSDIGSRNGTFVNGERISEPRRLNHGDVIGIGLSKLTFRLNDYSETGAIQTTELLNLPPLPPPLTEESLAQAVVAEGLVPKSEVERLRGADSKGRRLYRALTEERVTSEESLRDLMSRIFHIPVIDLRAAQIDEAIVGKFSLSVARDNIVFPVMDEAGRLVLAVADPTDKAVVETVTNEMRMPVEARLATPTEITEQINRHWGAKLIGVLPSGEKLEYLISQHEIEIGKAAHNHIVLTDPTVSNTHAILIARDGGYNIIDLGSRNGTFVNAERLGTRASTLRHGDSIQLGQTVLTFRNPSETTENVTATLSPEALEEVRRRAGFPDQGTPKSPSRTEEAASPLSPSHGAAQGSIAAPPLAANLTPASVPQPEGVAPAQARAESIATPGVSEEEKAKKEKKKKKGTDERLKAAYIGAVSRILAQVFAVLVAVGLSLYVARQSMAPAPDRPAVEMSQKGKTKLKLAGSGAGTAIRGGTFEASGVEFVPDSDGVIFVDDGRPGEVLWMQLDQSGQQVGQVKPIELGVSVNNPEGITYDGTYFYIIGSQTDPKAGDRNALVRFSFNPQDQTVQKVDVISDLRRHLVERVPELRGQGELKGEDGGLNIEGIAWNPDPEQQRLLLGLRSPIINGQALVVPIRVPNPSQPFTAENLQFDTTIQLSLGGLGIRDIEYDSRLKSFLIISGAPENQERATFVLWEWSGNADQSRAEFRPREEATLDPKMKPEGVTRARIAGRDFIFIVGDSSSYIKLDYSEAP